MSSITAAETVIRRLRAHGLVPAEGLVKLEVAGSRVSRPGKLAWQAVHPVTGAAYGVGSRSGLRATAAARDWVLVTAGDLTLVEPGLQNGTGGGIGG